MKMIFFEQPLEVMPETEEAVHESERSVADATPEARTGEKKEVQRFDPATADGGGKSRNPTSKSGDPPPKHRGARPGVPEMRPEDTGATGMLRLEDLDAHFAETVFGNDAGMTKRDRGNGKDEGRGRRRSPARGKFVRLVRFPLIPLPRFQSNRN